ncbi:MAG: hypothetical protein A3F47_02015 [Candidatus Staskawiczbacteria bacterium RIFCSPHIGHO2_12_FULL_38_11]|uniref:Integral membrane protein (PIN domain superfamily) n=1 Tax=Candidatus Staskawiczbacteria bacterium RIFCSPHIGHO2_12_FULL_38_11 TaxID=1802209 RepID=A0A1G2I592_9BACT|nr:MAG: hypothetical protein A3F47_02015 [Candidatus Staskawiczbacteria bacterium RIFCSPHIGHO2_12_FULL_38_11]
MEIVNFLAVLWGISFIIISLAFLIRQRYIEFFFSLMEDEKNLLLFGLINVMLGIALVLSYNVWDSSWRVIITVLAWLVTIRGIALLFLPDLIKKGLAKFKSKTEWIPLGLVVFVLFGCVLVYLGFSA